MRSFCGRETSSNVYEKIDGAVVTSRGNEDRNLNCTVTFQTASILQKFILRFELLELEHNDHLYIYEGDNAVGQHRHELSYRDSNMSVGVLFTQSNFLTLEFISYNWGTEKNGFNLVITAVKSLDCKSFQCTTPSVCIHFDLVCDGINHCSDNSDEDYNLCTSMLTGNDIDENEYN